MLALLPLTFVAAATAEYVACPATCSSQTCDYWIKDYNDPSMDCEFLTAYGCDCRGCSCPIPEGGATEDKEGHKRVLTASPAPSPGPDSSPGPDDLLPAESPAPGVANRPLDEQMSEEDTEVSGTDDALAAFAALQNAQTGDEEASALRVVVPVVGACAGLISVALIALLVLKLRKSHVAVISPVNKVAPAPAPTTPQPAAQA